VYEVYEEFTALLRDMKRERRHIFHIILKSQPVGALNGLFLYA
jgi:Cdc6-like AAA superfamily ATPase